VPASTASSPADSFTLTGRRRLSFFFSPRLPRRPGDKCCASNAPYCHIGVDAMLPRHPGQRRVSRRCYAMPPLLLGSPNLSYTGPTLHHIPHNRETAEVAGQENAEEARMLIFRLHLQSPTLFHRTLLHNELPAARSEATRCSARSGNPQTPTQVSADATQER
jgi:hypothetical protein